MTNNEKELIEMIRKAIDPETAMMIAAKTIINYLGLRESLKEQEPADPQEPYEKAL
jgi:hypothetical protein